MRCLFGVFLLYLNKNIRLKIPDTKNSFTFDLDLDKKTIVSDKTKHGDIILSNRFFCDTLTTTTDFFPLLFYLKNLLCMVRSFLDLYTFF